MQSAHASLARKFLEKYTHLPSYQGQCFLFGEISPTGDKKKPSATSKKGFIFQLSKNSPYFLEKKKKRKNSPDLDSESVELA